MNRKTSRVKSREAEGRGIHSVGILGNINKPGITELLEKIVRQLESSGVGHICETGLAKSCGAGRRLNPGSVQKILAEADMVFSLGGDGTFLNTARLVAKKNIPILGVNLGRLGFYSEVSPDEISRFIPQLLKGNYRITEQTVLKCEAGSKTMYAMNDIVVDKGSLLRMLELDISYNSEKIFRIVSDGVIVSTPSGSTAYSLSCSGPIVNPESSVVLITPISAHTLNVRPIITPDSGTVTIRILTHGKGRIAVDGQSSMNIKSISDIRVSKAPYTVKAVKKLSSSYFHTLKKKLHWGDDIRHKS